MPLLTATPILKELVEEYFWTMFIALVESQDSLTADTEALECTTVTTLMMLWWYVKVHSVHVNILLKVLY